MGDDNHECIWKSYWWKINIIMEDDIIKKALIKKGIENRDIVCRICDNPMGSSSKHLSVTTALDPTTKQVPPDGKNMAFAFIICTHCGHVEFFSAKHLGLI